MNKQFPIFVASFVLALVIGYTDYLTGAHVSMMLLYAVPILVAAWFCGTRQGIVVAAIAATSWFFANFMLQPQNANDAILSWNAFSRFGIFALLSYTVSLQVALKRALEHEQLRSRTDKLSGLLNKGAFREQVEAEIARGKRFNHSLSLAFIDLDNFKEVNDTQGHARGDRLIQHVSETIIQTIRKTDIAGRIGGDEFAICFPETDEEQVRKAISNLLKELDIMTSQSGWQVTASIGVVTCTKVFDNFDTLLGKADKLMYAAKEKGKNGAEYLVIDT